MTVAGIVAEYDPFHLGHQHMLRAIRRRLGEDTAVVAAMSASFTQRGDAAVCTPEARAEMALRGGVNLVLELPVGFSTASAETFARGGVGVLAASGVVDTLCFGSESGDLALLRELAQAESSPAYRDALRGQTALGLPFAAARQRALEATLGRAVPTGANDLLATEYLRALPEGMDALAIPRRDGGHGGAQSATQVRRLLRAGEWDAAFALLPESSRAVLERERSRGCCPGSLAWAERAVLYRLRTMTEEKLAALPDCGEGLEHRLAAAAGRAATLEEFYALAKSKRYAHARIRRIALRAFLDIQAVPDQVRYLRVLGADDVGLALLRRMKQTASLPVVTKPAHGRTLTGQAREDYLAARRCDDLWALCLEHPRPTGECWRRGPVLLRHGI